MTTILIACLVLTAIFLAVAVLQNNSNKILRERSEDLQKKNEEMLRPFQEKIRDLNELIAKSRNENKEDKGLIESELKNLKAAADGLTRALTGDAKQRGTIGEWNLKYLLGANGMNEGIDYKFQEFTKDEAGNNLYPDCIIYLPNNQKLIIDSKVNLKNYIDYCGEKDPDLQKQHMAKHVAAIKAKVKDLAGKDYRKYVKDNALDFVIMYLFHEPAYYEAWVADKGIYDDAVRQGIYVATPTSLMPILRAIRNLWNLEKQNSNMEEIVRHATDLHDKIARAMETMDTLKNSIASVQRNFNTAAGQLGGHGGATSIAKKLKTLGISSPKEIKDVGLIPDESGNDESA